MSCQQRLPFLFILRAWKLFAPIISVNTSRSPPFVISHLARGVYNPRAAQKPRAEGRKDTLLVRRWAQLRPRGRASGGTARREARPGSSRLNRGLRPAPRPRRCPRTTPRPQLSAGPSGGALSLLRASQPLSDRWDVAAVSHHFSVDCKPCCSVSSRWHHPAGATCPCQAAGLPHHPVPGARPPLPSSSLPFRHPTGSKFTSYSDDIGPARLVKQTGKIDTFFSPERSLSLQQLWLRS